MNTTTILSQIAALGVPFTVNADGSISVNGAAPVVAPAVKPAAETPAKPAETETPAAKPGPTFYAVRAEFRQLMFAKFPDKAERKAAWQTYNDAKIVVAEYNGRENKRGRKSAALKSALATVAAVQPILDQARKNVETKAAKKAA